MSLDDEGVYQSNGKAIVRGDGQRRVQIAARGLVMHASPEHARTFAASLLSAADEAEGKTASATATDREQERALVRALVNALPFCADEPEYGCEAAAGRQPNPATKHVGFGGCRYCDKHAPPEARDLHYAGPLRALLAQMAMWPTEKT